MKPEEMLVNPKVTIEILRKYDLKFEKKFGQNFLIDAHVIGRMIEGAQITREDTVIEIGPGIGTLTQFLAQSARRVISVEIDNKLIPVLGETLSEFDNTEVINADVMKLDIAQLLSDRGITGPVKVVANLPYYITTPIIMGLLEGGYPFKSITVMIQKEVARRIQAGPGTKDYGALSLAAGFYAKPYIVANVPANCFMPRPNVDSAVIRLTLYDEKPVQPKDEKLMFALIKAAFAQRRKTLANAVVNAGSGFTREDVEGALSQMGLPADIRGEKLDAGQFARLSDILGEKG
ncbi:MAG: 16S rRNA (adenine(1518)-N(6)/adenine(1519)-N(6))-dimethyltransferase RsmA [Lachnospiraceae bacterium]|nr:16S rRNA (adenine(1518)-N(6)/adenine(1519)-N(6))-dimethyltransferase RsmA [Lachnospiraceae bacterium]